MASTSPELLKAARAAATKYRVPLPTIIGVFKTESAARSFATIKAPKDFPQDNGRMPIIRHEGHYLNKRLTGADLIKAQKAGLASPKAGAIKNPSSQQARFEKLFWPAARISRPMEVESCSWGGPQVMGAHWKRLGFRSPDGMVDYMKKGESENVDVMMRYCKAFDLIDELQRGDIEGFVRGYNGPGNVASYSKQIRGHIATATKEVGTKAQNDPKKQVDGVPVRNVKKAAEAKGYLRLGVMNDARVREAQALLVRFGYALKVDGDFGTSTRDAVIAFQKEHKLHVDGMIGPETWAVLNTRRLDPNERPGLPGLAETLTATEEGKQGATIAGGATVSGGVLQSAKEQLQSAADQLFPASGGGGFVDGIYGWLLLAIAVIGILGVIWYFYGWFKAWRINKRATTPPDVEAAASIPPEEPAPKRRRRKTLK